MPTGGVAEAGRSPLEAINRALSSAALWFRLMGREVEVGAAEELNCGSENYEFEGCSVLVFPEKGTDVARRNWPANIHLPESLPH